METLDTLDTLEITATLERSLNMDSLTYMAIMVSVVFIEEFGDYRENKVHV